MDFRILPVMVLFFGNPASAQEIPKDPFSIGATMLSRAGCPLFVSSVVAGSPAERAGIRSGDRILAIEGTPVSDLRTAAHLLQSDRSGSVGIELARDDQELRVFVGRERQSIIYGRAGERIISGVAVPSDTTRADTTRAEVERMLSFDGRRIAGGVFMPTHYPRSPQVFYGGFELFVLRNPDQVMVGGIEEGPAARAGVHWGDVVISVNGVPVVGKTVSELEDLFSDRESKVMHLQVDRMGSLRSFEFRLERAGDIARQNGKRFVDAKIVPLWASKKDLHCFE